MAEVKNVYFNSGAVIRTAITDDEAPGRVVVHTAVDMTQVVEENKMLRDLQNPKSDFRMLARGVPLTVYEKSILEGWDESDWTRWLNDPDNAAFRIYQGRV